MKRRASWPIELQFFPVYPSFIRRPDPRMKIAALFLLFCAFSIGLAYAGIIDPLPLFQTVDVSQMNDLSDPSRPFLCPQTEKLYKENEKVVVETLMMEALGEGFDGMVAVGEVIRNRTRLFGRQAAEVCLMPKQFSCWNDPQRAESFLEKYRDRYLAAQLAWVVSEHSALTQGATDYHTDTIHPYWADAYRLATRIRSHLFYVRH
jgi:hypothetical protein